MLIQSSFSTTWPGTNKGSYTTYCEFRINQTGERRKEKRKKKKHNLDQ